MSLLDFLAGPNENIPPDQVEPLSYPVDDQSALETPPKGDPAVKVEQASPEAAQMGESVAEYSPLSLTEPGAIFAVGANQWSAYQIPLQSLNLPIKIVSADAARQVVVISNTSNAQTVFIGPSAGSVNNGGGYPINPNTSLTLPVSAEIYATANGPTIVGIMLLSTEGVRR